jgi:serine/threonine protein kinase
MAEIVKAREATPSGPRLVAIKRILPHLCADELYKAMFMDESRVLAQLDHASVIHAYRIGEIDNTPYIALEYVHGQDARELFHACQHTQQILPLPLACYIMARVCEGLQHAHEQTDADGNPLGIVHRDVSLQNILVGYDGDVKLCDFGIAVSAENQSRTDAGVVKGKFGYMSPEQIRGAALDRRSDVFATGICLYELITGQRLFSGENDYKAVERVRNVDIELPSALNRQIPSSLERIVLKALAKNPRDRYQTSNDMRRALQAFLAETNQFVERDDLASFMRELFADDYAVPADEPPPAEERPEGRISANVTAVQELPGQALFDDVEQTIVAGSGQHVVPDSPPPAADEPFREEPTGLAAFDHLPQVGSMPVEVPAARVAGRTGPAVPSLIPDPNSIPESASGLNRMTQPDPLGPQRFDMDWDEVEPTTVSQGFGGEAHAHEEDEGVDLSRPITPEPARPAPTPAFVPPIEPRSRGRLDPHMRGMPTLELRTQRTPFAALGVGVLVAVMTFSLVYFLMRDRADASLRLQTDPPDATVLVNGRRVIGQRSPFVVTGLSGSVRHTIVVEKPGFTSWSTTVRLPSDKEFQMPLVRLEPIAKPPPPPPPPPTAAEPASPPPEVTQPSAKPHHWSTRRSSSSSSSSRKSKPSDDGKVSSPKPAATASGATGTLRVNTRPWSRVSVDGSIIGNTPQMNIPLKPGTHRVTLENSEFGVKRTISVSIRAGETITRVLTLSP